MFAVGTNVQRIDGAERFRARQFTPAICACRVWRSRKCCAARCRMRASGASTSAEASALPGVLAMLTRDTIDVAANSFGAYVRDQQIIATDKVRYVGDMVAAVAAIDDAIAARGSEA